MYSNLLQQENMLRILTNLCGPCVYLMKMKGRPKAGRNLGCLSFMEEKFLERPHKSTTRPLLERRTSNSLYNGF